MRIVALTTATGCLFLLLAQEGLPMKGEPPENLQKWLVWVSYIALLWLIYDGKKERRLDLTASDARLDKLTTAFKENTDKVTVAFAAAADKITASFADVSRLQREADSKNTSELRSDAKEQTREIKAAIRGVSDPLE